MGNPYTAGVWIVKPGHEDEFIAAWRDFAEWTLRTIDGSVWGTLLRDREMPNRFMSFGPFQRIEDIESWRAHPGFAERVGRVRALCDRWDPSTLDEVTTIEFTLL
jgi:hypothetical protein